MSSYIQDWPDVMLRELLVITKMRLVGNPDFVKDQEEVAKLTKELEERRVRQAQSAA
jgi:hypothetical protein